MPYCPKCDMEFVDGITTCSDCGGPLVASKEEADRLKREEQLKRQKEQQNLTQEMLSMEMNGADADSFSGYASEDFHNLANSDDQMFPRKVLAPPIQHLPFPSSSSPQLM